MLKRLNDIIRFLENSLCRSRCKQWLAGGIMLLTLISCGDSRPEGVLGERKLRDVLYDYHLASAMADLKRDSADIYRKYYVDAVFDKYGITAKEFDNSMTYYTRHSSKLSGIYKQLNERLGKQTHSSAPVLAQSANGDTAIVWEAFSPVLLVAGRNNRLVEQIKVDTIVHPSDMLLLRFDSNWYYHDGNKQAYAIMQVAYEGDSVQSVSRSIYGVGQQELQMSLSDLQPKQIRLFIYQSGTFSERLRLLSLSNFSLFRIKGKEKLKPISLDSINIDSLNNAEQAATKIAGTDSLHRLPRPRP
ncbi:MAG: DUF4296 domain-containing protein [Alloprevotella sp.]|nr:DUF4296 domain-containing protein [Alloprevotella sp.]